MDPSIMNAAAASIVGAIVAGGAADHEHHHHHHHHHEHHEEGDHPHQSSPLVADPNAPGNFSKKVLDRQFGIVTFGLTPPRVTTESDKIKTLVEHTIERLSSMPIDTAIVYDIHDEADRNTGGVERPFPFVDTLDGDKFMGPVMEQIPSRVSCVYYRCVTKHSMEQMTDFVQRHKTNPRSSCVFVGAASSAPPPTATQQHDGDAASTSTVIPPPPPPPPPKLSEVYKMHQTLTHAAAKRAPETVTPSGAPATQHVPATSAEPLVMGAVAIPERHRTKSDEHERMIAKQKQGCKFFVTQVVFSAELTKNMLSDYMVSCKAQGLPMVPVILTFAPVGSMRTFEFMRWLGVEPSRWLENDLKLTLAEAAATSGTNNAVATNNAVLAESIDAILAILRDIAHWAKSKGIPLGVNIESVAIRKAEIDAAVELVSTAKKILMEA